MVIGPDEKRQYRLLREEDGAILEGIHELEQLENLSEDEQFLLHFLRTQLEDDWRTPCLDILNIWKANKTSSPTQRWRAVQHVRTKWWHPNK